MRMLAVSQQRRSLFAPGTNLGGRAIWLVVRAVSSSITTCLLHAISYQRYLPLMSGASLTKLGQMTAAKTGLRSINTPSNGQSFPSAGARPVGSLSPLPVKRKSLAHPTALPSISLGKGPPASEWATVNTGNRMPAQHGPRATHGPLTGHSRRLALPPKPWMRAPASPSEYHPASSPSKIAQSERTGERLWYHRRHFARKPCQWQSCETPVPCSGLDPPQYGKPWDVAHTPAPWPRFLSLAALDGAAWSKNPFVPKLEWLQRTEVCR